MIEIHFHVTEDAINGMSVEDYEAFERAQDGEIKIYRLRPAMCRFMVDENKRPMPHEQALQITKKMQMSEIRSFIEQFFETMKASAVPNATGSPSNSPSEAGQADSASPDGSEP